MSRLKMLCQGSMMEEDRAISNLSRADEQEPGDISESVLEASPIEATRTPKRRFVGRRTAASSNTDQASGSNGNASNALQPAASRKPPRALNRIPPQIQNDAELNAAIALLPENYDFEVQKTVHRIRTAGSRHIGLQFPEGLLLFATTLADIFSRFGAVPEENGNPGEQLRVSILGDVTYGACCVDDFTARALGCDLLVHYAHSCLIPRAGANQGLQVLYVFVDIGIDMGHLMETVKRNFQPGKSLALFGTVQFNAALHALRAPLEQAGYGIVVPQSAPLSRGEILGCTAPTMNTSTATSTASSKGDLDKHVDILLYLGDGRFHLEAAMIANPQLPAYRYDPYSRELSREHYEHNNMRDTRAHAIATARGAQRWGLILGALGRQGNPPTLGLIEQILQSRGVEVVKMVLSEVTPTKLGLVPDIDVWVQVACPRLSIDWGYAFPKPLLSPYEALVALNVREASWEKDISGEKRSVYPMDYYAKEGLGRVTEAHVLQQTQGLTVGS